MNAYEHAQRAAQFHKDAMAHHDGFVKDDGGRERAGFKGTTGDCAARALAIAAQIDYRVAYDLINDVAKYERRGKRKKGISNARTGVYGASMRKLMLALGWQWVPTMGIGTGCKVHLIADELPPGRLLVCVSKHYTAVIDGVIHDTYDPRREAHCTRPLTPDAPLKPNEWTHDGVMAHHIERRCVYGYYIKRDTQ
jgi:hypothetical protein